MVSDIGFEWWAVLCGAKMNLMGPLQLGIFHDPTIPTEKQTKHAAAATQPISWV